MDARESFAVGNGHVAIGPGPGMHREEGAEQAKRSMYALLKTART